MSRTTETSTRDRGASLILAIGFVLLIGLIVGALTTLIASSANNRVSLINLRDRQYAAEAGIEEAIVSTIKLLLVYSAFHFIIKYW